MACPLPPSLAALAPYCSPQSGPGAGPFQAVRLEGLRVTAETLKITLRDAMIRCLEHDVWPLRFARNRGVFTAAEQRALLASHAAIMGCGGLGGHVATLLARAGVGAFTLCDFDVFDESNYNRQLLCREDTLGRNKADVTREELAAVASHAAVRVVPERAAPDNLPEILRGADIVMDCLDSLETRHQVAAVANRAAIPFVHGAVAGDEGFAMLTLPGAGGLDSLYPPETAPDAGIAESRLGVPTLPPAAVAVLQAGLALRLLAGREPDQGQLLHLDVAAPMLESLQIAPGPKNGS